MVNISFNGPDFSRAERWTDHVDIAVDNFDLDYGCITMGFDDGVNLTLAVPANMSNEEGKFIGKVGWRILPDDELLDRRPDLAPFVGLIFGRVIVSGITS